MDERRKPSGGDLAKFGAALLATIGVGGVATWWRNRKRAPERALSPSERAGHELSDVRGGALFGVVIGAVLFLAVLGVGLRLVFGWFMSAPVAAIGPVSDRTTPQALPPAPRLQSYPQADLLALQATQTALLHSYGVDPTSGVIHIPIDRAMDLLATRGLTTTGETPTPTGSTPVAPTVGVAEGQVLFARLGCVGCHRTQEGTVGPPLQGVFGAQVRLASGETVTADEAYIRTSILNPQTQIVAGYQPVMPSFQGRVTDAELAQLVAYIRSLEVSQR